MDTRQKHLDHSPSTGEQPLKDVEPYQRHRDLRLLSGKLFRTEDKHFYATISNDDGKTWTRLARINPCSIGQYLDTAANSGQRSRASLWRCPIPPVCCAESPPPVTCVLSGTRCQPKRNQYTRGHRQENPWPGRKWGKRVAARGGRVNGNQAADRQKDRLC